MNRVFASAFSVPKTCVRRLSTTEVNCGKPDLSAIKQKQAHFQAPNETPVYLKGGSLDYALFFTTLGLIVVGVSSAIHSAYNLATKK